MAEDGDDEAAVGAVGDGRDLISRSASATSPETSSLRVLRLRASRRSFVRPRSSAASGSSLRVYMSTSTAYCPACCRLDDVNKEWRPQQQLPLSRHDRLLPAGPECPALARARSIMTPAPF
jgi:hypothetical protein